MTVPQRISDFLSQRQERMYCDTCIQERLGLKWRQQVQLITATLAVTAGFRRGFNKCCTCEEIKQVTHATCGQPPAAAAAKPKLSAKELGIDRSPRRRQLGSDQREAEGLDTMQVNTRFGVSAVQPAEFPVTASNSALGAQPAQLNGKAAAR